MMAINRTAPIERDHRGAGLSQSIPVLLWRFNGYDLVADEMREGWWVFSIRWRADPIVAGQHQCGLSLRITWGWSISPRPATAEGRA